MINKTLKPIQQMNVYVGLPSEPKMEKIGTTNVNKTAYDIIYKYALSNSIHFTRLETRIQNDGIRFHFIKGNYDLMFISIKEEASDNDKC